MEIRVHPIYCTYHVIHCPLRRNTGNHRQQKLNLQHRHAVASSATCHTSSHFLAKAIPYVFLFVSYVWWIHTWRTLLPSTPAPVESYHYSRLQNHVSRLLYSWLAIYRPTSVLDPLRTDYQLQLPLTKNQVMTDMTKKLIGEDLISRSLYQCYGDFGNLLDIL